MAPGKRGARTWGEWTLFVVVLGAFAAVLAFDLLSSRRAIESTERSRLEHQARSVGTRIGSRLEATSNGLGLIRDEYRGLLVQEDGAARLNERLQVMASSMAGVRTLILVNAEGVGIASNRKELIGTTWKDGERYRAIRARPDPGLVFVSPPFMTPLGNWAISVGRVILDEKGAFDGYVLAILDPEYLNATLDSTRYATDVAAALIHGAGKIVYRIPDPNGAVGTDLSKVPGSSFGRHVQGGQPLTFWTAPVASTGRESFIALQTVRPSVSPSDGFLVAFVARETAAIFAPWRKDLRDRVGILAIAALVSGSALFLFQRRRRAAERSEERYRGLVELSPSAVFVNRGGRIDFVNRAALALFGAERVDQLLGRSPFELFHPDCHPLMRERLAILQAGGTAPPALEKIVRLDGTTRDVEVAGAPFQVDRGLAFQVVVRDVTDERRREAELRESEQRFRALFEGATDGIVTADPDTGRLLSCNAAFAAMTGYAEQEIPALRFEDLHEPQDRPAVAEAFAAMAAGMLRSTDGTPVRRKDGSVFPADITAAHVVLPDRTFLAAFFRDVTERRAAAAALQASEARYRLLVESLPIGVTEADAQGRNVYSNAACQVIVGRAGEEIRESGWHEAIHPDDRDRLLSDWYAAVQAGRPYDGDYRLLRPDGEVRHVHGFASALPGPDGSVRGYLGVVRDVTSEKAARAAAEESRAILLAALASMSDAVFVTDRDGNFILFNDAFATIHRFANRDACARTLAEYPNLLGVSFPDGKPAPLDQWAVPRALRGESVTNAIYLMRRKDTGETWVGSYSFAPIRRDGVIVGSVVVGRDVTAQKRAEDGLRASEQRFRDVVASADEYIFEMDPAGRVTYISEAVEGVLGYRPDEVVGRSSLEFMGPEEQARSAAYLAERVARRERISHLQQEAVHRSGRPVWLDISAVPVIDDAGALVGYRGAALDITKRHLAEQERAALQAQLAQSQKLEGIGRLAGGVAHDFNNILSVILSCAGFALGGLKEGDPLREDILEIDKGARRAAALTRQLLAFSRKQVLQPVSVDLNQALREMEKMLRRIIGEDIDLVQDLAPDLGTVRVDPGQIEQVIMNVVVNARDAMPDGGKLTIETANVELDDVYARHHAGSSPGPHVMLAITDSGTGMDEKTQARIFEPFFTTKGPGKGNGLGLSTVYGIVKQSGGSIFVYSEVGRGTTFKVFLPRETSGAAPAPPPLPSTARAVRGETILVVEDDEAVRGIARRMLAGAGYEVLTAANGGEGLLTCESHPGEIHLVLTDVVMPMMGGRAFAERLARIRPGLKVLFMSGYTDDAIVHHGVLEPGTHFVTKPFTQADLLAKVRDVLDEA